ncbi:hypothetical protein ACKKBG_A35395 [Auxenochlorella protothecoides x Auxenochlorella symbiontica]
MAMLARATRILPHGFTSLREWHGSRLACRAAPHPPAPPAPATDYTLLSACVRALEAGWTPSRVDTVVQVSGTSLALALRTAEAHTWLHLSWHTRHGHLGLGPPPPRRGDPLLDSHALGAVLKAQLAGLVLTRAALVLAWERLVRLDLEAPRGGSDSRRRIYLELTGRHANLAVTDSDDVILAAGHQVGPAQSAARPLQRGAATVQPLLEAARSQIQQLRETRVLLEQLEVPADAGVLKEVQAELAEAGLLRSAKVPSTTGKRANKKPSAAPASSPRRFCSPSGLAVLVGRTSAQNETLSTRTAAAWDVWMHARGAPGAHLLLRLNRGQSPPNEDLGFCADLAAWFSSARGSTAVDVTVAWARDVSKPRGAAKGRVAVKKEMAVLQGRPDREERWAAAAEERAAGHHADG